MKRSWFLRIEWKPQDCWVGVFWEQSPFRLDIWVCVVPMLPLHFGWKGQVYAMPSTPASPPETTP